MNCILNSSSEVNVLSYVTALFPEFVIFSDIQDEVMMDIKDTLFCEYMSDMSVHLEDVEVRLSFFIS